MNTLSVFVCARECGCVCVFTCNSHIYFFLLSFAISIIRWSCSSRLWLFFVYMQIRSGDDSRWWWLIFSIFDFAIATVWTRGYVSVSAKALSVWAEIAFYLLTSAMLGYCLCADERHLFLSILKLWPLLIRTIRNWFDFWMARVQNNPIALGRGSIRVHCDVLYMN